MLQILGLIALAVIAVAIILLAVVWLAFQNDPFEQGAPRRLLWGIAADYVIGGAILLLGILAAWIGRATGIW